MVPDSDAERDRILIEPPSALENELRTKLETLVPGVRVSGVAGTGPVDIVAIKWVGGNFLTVTYTDAQGHSGQAVLRRDDEPRLALTSAGRTRAFDSDAEASRLAAEALHIRYAALFDPMLAISTSDLQALPHQIRAVYGELLPRTPLRFLLGDDPAPARPSCVGCISRS